MTKMKFLMALHDKLSGLPQDEVEERLSFYSEIIEDRIEEGMSEEEAVLAVGSVEEIYIQILEEIPLLKIAKETIKPKRRLKIGELILLILGSPLWISLLAVAASVIFTLYIVLWVIVISLWAVFVSLVSCSLGMLAFGVINICYRNVLHGLASISVACVLAGLSIFTFWGCKLATRGAVLVSKKIVYLIKRCFVKKEAK